MHSLNICTPYRYEFLIFKIMMNKRNDLVLLHFFKGGKIKYLYCRINRNSETYNKI